MPMPMSASASGPPLPTALVPISLVAKREVLGQPAPLYLYGYGAYGECLDPWFSHARLSLLDRGFVFAIAHVRGGGVGEAWYRAGKLEHKQNSFSDFIACAEHLIAEGYTSSQLVISGGSAGGLLMGAVLNQRPELFAAAIAEVPLSMCSTPCSTRSCRSRLPSTTNGATRISPRYTRASKATRHMKTSAPSPTPPCWWSPATTTVGCNIGRPPSGSHACVCARPRITCCC
uniref:Peptidase S9 prolyl oligopeptidase catalytic domain-containing protein n=1 Tax=Pseudomonas marincola TaxID=437900 RepID=A0A653DZ20_9PSED